MPAWIALQRERALVVATLLRLNRESRAMLAPLINPNGTVSGLPAAFTDRPAGTFLLGNGAVKGGDGDMFLKACLAAGIITQAEIDKASRRSDELARAAE